MHRIIVTFLITLLMANTALGQGPCQKDFSSPNDLLECVLRSHPEIQAKEAEQLASGYDVRAASQLPNPDLDAKVTTGTVDGLTSTTSENLLLFPLFPGGKRGALIDRAKSLLKLSGAAQLSTIERVKIDFILLLHRLRQIRQEVSVTEEALETFSKIQAQYKRRPKLGPEQSVSLDIFSLAYSDYVLKKDRLLREEAELKIQLEFGLAHKVEINGKILPPTKTSWPRFERVSEEAKSSDAQIASLQSDVAAKEVDLTRAESWPDIKIGPAYNYQVTGRDRAHFIGVGLSMPLPIFNWNQGQRAAAAERFRAAEVRTRGTLDLLKKEKTQLIETYNRQVKTFEEIRRRSDIFQKHLSLHRFLERGIVPAPLVIESHRQMIDFTDDLNERELETLRILWRLYALDGRTLKETLE